MKKRLKIFNKLSSSAGFTLIELLVAMLITTIVVSLAGFGLVTLMKNDSKAQAETSRRIELNRALDFMADEVRQAKAIATDASASLATVAPNFTNSGTPVLTLEIPGVSQRVLYFISSPGTGSPWLGPKVIYRWGPTFNANGNYTDATTPASWQGEPLVDLIEDSTPSPNNNCPTGWSPNPTVVNRQGFYACVDSAGRITEIYLRGKLTGAYGNSLTPYQVSTRVFARSATP